MKNKQVLIFAFIVSMASMVYEFALSHFLFIYFGGFVSKYILITSSFIFFLGLGALFYEKTKKSGTISLIKVEFTLSFLGLLSTVIPILYASFIGYGSFLFFWIYISIIALLSGIELPALMNLGTEKLKILGFDYLGMIAAALLFPFFFLSQLGLLPTLYLISSLNFIMAVFLQYKLYRTYNMKIIISFVVLLLGISANQDKIQELFLA